jgi:phospholipid/cholesterol/gamma-HCH transport system substrate-binding protein
MMFKRAAIAATGLVLAAGSLSGCQWRGLNSLPLPGTEGGGPGSIVITAELPDVNNIEPNSRVRVGDVTVGNVTKVERRGWHAVLTMSINAGVDLPANATAKIGQTSLLGSLHVELAPPTNLPPQGTLHDGSTISLASGAAYPSTEQTLSSIALVLNGGGIGNVQDIVKSLSTAFGGREQALRSLIEQLDQFITALNGQTDDIVAATDSFNRLAGQFADRQPVLDRALKTLPDALTVLKNERDTLVEAANQLGKFNSLAAESVNQTKEAFVSELRDLGPVLESLANAGPALTRSLSFFSTFPFPKENVTKFFRGDAVNVTGIFDLTLSRLDANFLTGTRFEGALTKLEMQWGRTIGQMPSPYTSGNPLVAPYQADQGR